MGLRGCNFSFLEGTSESFSIYDFSFCHGREKTLVGKDVFGEMCMAFTFMNESFLLVESALAFMNENAVVVCFTIWLPY